MNKTNLPVSLKDTTELRRLIIENPDLPLLIFCGEESWDGEHAYSSAFASSGSIQELTLYEDGYDAIWMDRKDYAEKLSYDLDDKEEYKDMTHDEYDKMIDQKVKETEFVKAIVIYVG